MKFEFKNRYGLKIVGHVYEPSNAQGLVFLQHGLSGARIQKHMQEMQRVFFNAGYVVVNFDTTHSFGDSEGDLRFSTLSNHADDLEDVIRWASTQPFYQEPFVLAGHSLGGASILRYVERNPDKVKAMAPLSACVSGDMLKRAEGWANGLGEWESKGYFIKNCSFKEGLKGEVSWSFMEDMQFYDFTKKCL